MHILCISLTEKQNQGARAIQFAKVVSALHKQGATITVITRQNDKLADLKSPGTRIIYADPGRNTDSKNKSGSLFSRIAGKMFPTRENSTRLAVAKAMEVVERERPDCIFSSSNPVASHFAGLEVARKTGLPWLASFSDPKPSTMLPPPYGSRLKRLIPKTYTYGLRKVLHHCDAVHMPTSLCIEATEKYYHISLSEKSVVIPPIGETAYLVKRQAGNGYLVHLGSITKRLSAAFLSAIATFSKESPERMNEVLFVGKHQTKTASLMTKAGLGQISETKPQVSHNHALDIVSEAGAVLILEADMTYSHALPSKFAEAAFSGTPILAVTPAKSAVREYLNTYGGGVAATHSAEDIIRALREVFNSTPEDLNKMQNEQKALAENFSFDEVGKNYMDAFKRIIAQKNCTQTTSG